METLSMLRARTCRSANFTDYILLAVFLILAYVFIQRRGYMSQVNSVIETSAQSLQYNALRSDQPGIKGKNPSGKFFIDERIRKIPDTRSENCKSHRYKASDKVSIITEFSDYQFYDLKTTLGSIVYNTPKELIEEILVVDDGSTLDYIKSDAKKFVEGIPNAKLLRLESRKNTAGARTYAVKHAKADLLVFVDTNVICNTGWLQPLVEYLQQSGSSIAIPHYDSINDPVSYQYSATADNLITVFSWTLTMRMSQLKAAEKQQQKLDTPVMRGNLFAVRKAHFAELGGFDENLQDAGALNLELSFRTWMCGGSLRIIPCSRVGVLSLNNPIKIAHAESVRHIAELWVGDRKEFVYKTIETQTFLNMKDLKATTERKQHLNSLQCKGFEWYLKNIAMEIYTPSKEAKYYGLLKCRSGRCASVGDDQRVDLGKCQADTYSIHGTEQLFEYTDAGNVKTRGKCLAVMDSAYVLLSECKHNDTKYEWDYRPGGHLTNRWSSYCAMHVTDPDKKVPKGRQILMAQECALDTHGQFVSWDFVMP